jgi:hypothetical protein
VSMYHKQSLDSIKNLQSNKDSIEVVSKIKKDRKIIAHHLNEVSYGGTDKYVYNLIKGAQRLDDTFDHCLFYKGDSEKLERLNDFIEVLGIEKCIPYYSEEEFIGFIRVLKPFVLHRHAGGISEFPFVREVREHCENFVDTGIFGNNDDSIEIERVIHISEYLKYVSGRSEFPKYRSIYWPVLPPLTDEDLREELSIPKDATVFGRIGRSDSSIFHNINLKAFSFVQSESSYLVVLSPSDYLREQVRMYDIKNIRYVDKTTDDKRISAFYNTIDVLAHARRDGETFGMNIAEAMGHGKPSISHYTEYYNGHLETIADSGFVVYIGDYIEYAKYMQKFIDKMIDISYLKNRCKELFKRFDYDKQIVKVIDVYKELL